MRRAARRGVRLDGWGASSGSIERPVNGRASTAETAAVLGRSGDQTKMGIESAVAVAQALAQSIRIAFVQPRLSA